MGLSRRGMLREPLAWPHLQRPPSRRLLSLQLRSQTRGRQKSGRTPQRRQQQPRRHLQCRLQCQCRQPLQQAAHRRHQLRRLGPRCRRRRAWQCPCPARHCRPGPCRLQRPSSCLREASRRPLCPRPSWCQPPWARPWHTIPPGLPLRWACRTRRRTLAWRPTRLCPCRIPTAGAEVRLGQGGAGTGLVLRNMHGITGCRCRHPLRCAPAANAELAVLGGSLVSLPSGAAVPTCRRARASTAVWPGAGHAWPSGCAAAWSPTTSGACVARSGRTCVGPHAPHPAAGGGGGSAAAARHAAAALLGPWRTRIPTLRRPGRSACSAAGPQVVGQRLPEPPGRRLHALLPRPLHLGQGRLPSRPRRCG